MHDDATVEMTDELTEDEQAELEEELERERIQREEDLQMLGGKLHRLAHEQVAARQQIETRWLRDIRQYHGEYTPDELARMRGKSSVFVNITRNKTRAGIARLGDMLLPNDDTNFGVEPTPVPATSKLGKAMGAMGAMGGEAGEAPMMADMQGMAMQEGDPGVSPELDEQDRVEEAAREMQQQIEDDFKEADYNAHARDVIEDACILGTGILKGPTVVNRTRRAWHTDPHSGQSVMEVQEEFRAGLERVDPWDAFPDMSATCPEEAEFWFERKLVNRKQLRELADLPGVMLDQLRNALQDEDGRHIAEDRRHELREITGVDTVTSANRWEMWEYWGPLDKEELRACGVEDVDDDPLVEYTGCVLMVGRHVIKAAINPLDTGDLPYSVFNWEQDGASIFGFGVPYLMRQPQRVINAAWRMMMDNAAVSAGPQVVVNKRAVKPLDGDWTIRSMKVWEATGDMPVEHAFQAFHVQSNQADLAAIFQMAQELADTETNLPILLQGEGVGGGEAGRTLGGMQMLMNNSNIVLRSAVKNYDDGITKPTVRRFYDYHMAYTDRPEIKGDFDVHARGTSVLIAREEQQEKLMMLAQVAAQNPIFAELTKWDGLYRELLRTLQVPVDVIAHSKEEVEEMERRAQEQGGEVPPEMELQMAELQLKEQELQLKMQDQEFEQQYRQAELQHKQEKDHAELAMKHELTVGQLQAKLGIDQQKLQLEMEKTAAQVQNDRDKTAAQLMDRQNQRAMVDGYKQRKYGA